MTFPECTRASDHVLELVTLVGIFNDQHVASQPIITGATQPHKSSSIAVVDETIGQFLVQILKVVSLKELSLLCSESVLSGIQDSVFLIASCILNLQNVLLVDRLVKLKESTTWCDAELPVNLGLKVIPAL